MLIKYEVEMNQRINRTKENRTKKCLKNMKLRWTKESIATNIPFEEAGTLISDLASSLLSTNPSDGVGVVAAVGAPERTAARVAEETCFLPSGK